MKKSVSGKWISRLCMAFVLLAVSTFPAFGKKKNGDVVNEEAKQETTAEAKKLLVSECFYNEKLPIGCKVRILNDEYIFRNPSSKSEKLNCFKKGDIVTSAMLGREDMKSSCTRTKNGAFWVKIVSDDFNSGWIHAEHLEMVSENPNPVSMKRNWSFYGAYGASFSPDGKYVCLKNWGAHNGFSGTVHIFDVESGNEIITQDAGSDYDADSSEHTVFSLASKYLFYEENLTLYAIDIKNKKTISFGCPISDHGSIKQMLISNDSNKILYIYNWCNERYSGSVCDLKSKKWKNLSSEELEKMRKDFKHGNDVVPYIPSIPNSWGSCVKILPEKNLLICPADIFDHDSDGVYFFELSTGRFIKAENPVYDLINPSSPKDIIIEGFEINDDGTKIAVACYDESKRVDRITYYICDLNLDGLSTSVPENTGDVKVQKEKEAMNYLRSDSFSIVDLNNQQFVAKVVFDCDNVFRANDNPNGFSAYGTYFLEYDAEQDKVKIDFDDVYYCMDGGYETENYVNRHLGAGWIDSKTSDFWNVGGVKAIDDDDMFIHSNTPSKAYQKYYFNGIEVIKYPYEEGEGVRIRIEENLKMRDAPSLSANPVYMPFNGYVNGEYRNENRCIVFAGQEFYIRASSTEESTIDGITAPWYMIFVCEDETDEWTEGKYVWIFGGYVSIINEDR